jgi:hypothetical protein
LALAEIEPKLDRAIDPLWVSRQSLEAGEKMLKPGCGWLPSSWMPHDALRRALRALARRRQTLYLTDYGEPRGLAVLRQFLSRRLATRASRRRPTRYSSPIPAPRRSTLSAASSSSRATLCSSMIPAISTSSPCCAPIAQGS